MKKTSLVFFTGALLGAVSTPLFAQGALAPPGAPAANMKSLDQLDAKLSVLEAKAEGRTAISATNTPGTATAVFALNAPGSYYLTANVTGTTGKSGIVVTASNVTIDLNGFTLTGVTGAVSGILFSTPDRVNIRNGIVTGWPSGGLAGSGSDGSRIENITAVGNTGTGISVGTHAILTGCIARSNTGTTGSGIVTGAFSAVSDCTAASNGQHGISTGANSSVAMCAASSNTVAGINTGNDCLVDRCTSTLNASGILSVAGSIITGNDCTSNASSGIRATGGTNRIDSNTCRANGSGFSTSVGGNLVIRNLASGNGDIDPPDENYQLTGLGAGPIILPGGMAANTNPFANFNF
jgi:hypothetical protein